MQSRAVLISIAERGPINLITFFELALWRNLWQYEIARVNKSKELKLSNKSDFSEVIIFIEEISLVQSLRFVTYWHKRRKNAHLQFVRWSFGTSRAATRFMPKPSFKIV